MLGEEYYNLLDSHLDVSCAFEEENYFCRIYTVDGRSHRLRRGRKIREAMNYKLQNGKTQAPSKIAGANFSVITLSKLKSAVYFKGMC